jgi:hypothetical protein
MRHKLFANPIARLTDGSGSTSGNCNRKIREDLTVFVSSRAGMLGIAAPWIPYPSCNLGATIGTEGSVRIFTPNCKDLTRLSTAFGAARGPNVRCPQSRPRSLHRKHFNGLSGSGSHCRQPASEALLLVFYGYRGIAGT